MVTPAGVDKKPWYLIPGRLGVSLYFGPTGVWGPYSDVENGRLLAFTFKPRGRPSQHKRLTPSGLETFYGVVADDIVSVTAISVAGGAIRTRVHDNVYRVRASSVKALMFAHRDGRSSVVSVR
jgi:hypothetical protein